MTRLQKLLFLAQQETGVQRWLEVAYEFVAYRFGPHASALHDDLEYLESFGIIERPPGALEDEPLPRGTVRLPSTLLVEARRRASVSAADVVETRHGFDYLLDDDSDATLSTEYQERVFKLTPAGEAHAHRALETMPEGISRKVYDALAGIKHKYGTVPLRALLRDVYARYRDWAIESEIANLL